MTCVAQEIAGSAWRNEVKRVAGFHGLRDIAGKPCAKEPAVLREEALTNRVHVLDRLSYPRSGDDAYSTLLTHLPGESRFGRFDGIHPSAGKMESGRCSHHAHASTHVRDHGVARARTDPVGSRTRAGR